jgi:hypothetical protein
LDPTLPVVAFVAVGVAAIIAIARLRARRRYARLRISGGRKSLALNLFDRS